MSTVGQIRPVPRSPAAPGVTARPPLRVVPGNQPRRRPGNRRARVLVAAIALLIAGGMFATVGAQVVLTQRQLRLDQMNQNLSQAQLTNDQLALQVAKLESPSRIVSQAETKLHMAPPTQVIYLRPGAPPGPGKARAGTAQTSGAQG